MHYSTIVVYGVLLLARIAIPAHGQAPGVPIHHDERIQTQFIAACDAARKVGEAQPLAKLQEQLERKQCALELPAAQEKRLTTTEIWEAANRSSVHVILHYLCPKCDHWHVSVAGGCILTADGAIATSGHVIANKPEMREGSLFVVTRDGRAHPVLEILAANLHADVAILKIHADNLIPMPMNPNTRPGESIFCLSNPQNHVDTFTGGQIARFYWRDAKAHARRKGSDGKEGAAGSPEAASKTDRKDGIFMAVTLDYAAGSSGSAILDDRGNAVGFVQSTEPIFWEGKRQAEDHQMTIHHVSTAREILNLIRLK